MIKRILFIAMLLFSHLSVSAGITDGKFSKNQIFDVQYWWNGTTLNASNFIAPFNMNFQPVSVGTGQYFQFFPSTTNPGKYGLGLYNSNGTLAQVVHNFGDITALGNGAIFYIGSGFFGNVISTGAGYDYGASAQFTNMDTSVTAADITNYTWASTTPLSAGQTAAPTAPVVTVTGTAVTYTTRNVVNGNTTTVYRTPVTTTTYSDGTSTNANGTEALYQTRVASNVVTNKIVGSTLTTYTTPINKVTTDGVTTIEANGAVVTTTQTVQQGLTYQVWRYDYKNYSCTIFGCIAIPFSYRTPSTNINDYGNTVRTGVTSGGMYLQTNARLPNGDGGLFTYNDGTVIRYTGTITAPMTSANPAGSIYRLYFYNNTDDGFKMLVNGQLIINQDSTNTWQSVGGYTNWGWMDVVAGQTYNLEAWYWNVLGGVGHRFYWDFGAGIQGVPNSAFTTGAISAATIDTTGVAYSNSSVVNYSGTSVSLYPTYVTLGTGTPGDMVFGSSDGPTLPQQTNIDVWTNKTITDGNKIYIDQVSGSNNTVTMDQDGNKNLINATISGNTNSVTAKQGVPGVGQNEIKLNLTGDSNTLNINQARTTLGSPLGTNGHYQNVEVTGYQNTVTTQQTNTGGVGGQYMETTVNGNQNSVVARQTDNGNKIMFTSITGNNNTVEAVQKGTGQHYLENRLTGNGNSVSALQEGSIANRATIDLTNNGGPASVILQQTGGQNVSVTTGCATAGGCAPVTVRQGY